MYILCLSVTSKYVNDAVERISKEGGRKLKNGEESVLEKLLKVNRDYAFIMAVDMLMAGIDTVKFTFYLK